MLSKDRIAQPNQQPQSSFSLLNWCRRNPMIVSACFYVIFLVLVGLNQTRSVEHYKNVLKNFIQKFFKFEWRRFLIYWINFEILCTNIANYLLSSLSHLITSRHELWEEVLWLRFDRLLPVIHNVAFLLPVIWHLLQLHLTFDYKHIDDADVWHILVFYEHFTQFLSTLLLILGKVEFFN